MAGSTVSSYEEAEHEDGKRGRYVQEEYGMAGA